jgi:hypothetical protein
VAATARGHCVELERLGCERSDDDERDCQEEEATQTVDTATGMGRMSAS